MAIAPPHPSLFVSLGIAALVIWRVYARIRRMVGRQRFSPRRPWFTVVLFPLLLVLLGVGAAAHPGNLLGMAIGVVLGAGLGVYGLRLTKFEVTEQGRFYTPNVHLGIGLSLLFIGRLAYRFVQIYAAADPGPMGPPDFARSPLTLAIFGTLAGYYVAYAIGLLRWSRRVIPAA